MKIETNKIINGDCLEVMKSMPSNSVDTLITDPPYGLKFMGKKWDYDVPSIEIWKECLRVLKHGGTALIFAGSRTQHRMACNIEDAGFILKDCIMWLYGSGFPKATDISKQLDKRAGKKGKIIGVNPNHRNKENYRGTLKEMNQHTGDGSLTEPTDENAKLWNGWNSHGLKSAYEPILVCMKQNEGSYADNALKYGVSGLNIDGGRIGTGEKDDRHAGKRTKTFAKKEEAISGGEGSLDYVPNTKGRFPANIILDEESAKLLDEQSGERNAGAYPKLTKKFTGKSNITFRGKEERNERINLDKGGASRFFYTAKASKGERDIGCEELEKKKGGSYEFRQDGSLDGKIPIRQNTHPTVKPLKLMEYLCLLTKTPTGGIVLDCFAGSGSTGIACKKTGRDYILIEKEKEYCEIAEARLKAIQKPMI